MRADRQRHLPWALDGGSPGTPSYHLVKSNGSQRVLPQNPMYPLRLAQGEIFVHIGAGGAGVGDPLERDPARVLEDVREERISADYARNVYGVVIDDAGKTAQLRVDLRRSRDPHKPKYLEYFLSPLGLHHYRLDDGRNLSAR
jgi:N-methylhydantoinase B